MGKIGVRAAAILVKEGKILLANHRKHGRSYWVLPGGHVEPGETLTEALAREMREELELDVTVGPLAIVHDYITADRHVVNNSFIVEAGSGQFHVHPTKTLKDARWVLLGELDGIDLRPPMAELLRKVIEDPPQRTIYLGRI